jgi:hypothetical protein
MSPNQTNPSSAPAKRFLRYLPLSVAVLFTAQVFLSGCPDGGNNVSSKPVGGDSSTDLEQGAEDNPAAPTVMQARSDDSRGQTIEFHFNVEVSENSATDSSHYSASGGQTATSVAVLADGSTVRVLFDSLLLPGRDTVSVTGVKTSTGETFPAGRDLPINSDDRRPPRTRSVTLESMPGVNNDQLIIVFNDDMLEDDVLTMSHYSLQYPQGSTLPLSQDNASYNANTRTLTVVLEGDNGQSFDLTTNTAWSLAITNVRDLGGNSLVDANDISGQVTGDETAPVVLSVTQNSLIDPGGTVIDIMVNETVEAVASMLLNNFQSSNGAIAVQVQWLEESETLRLTMDRPVTPGVDNLSIGTLGDPAGNFTSITQSHTIQTNDGLAPTLVSLAGETVSGHFNDQVVVEFDERVHPSDAVDPARFVIESPLGVTVDLSTATFTYDSDLRQTTVHFGGDFLWESSSTLLPRQLGIQLGAHKNDGLGYSVSAIGDLDGDGFSDIVIGAPEYDSTGLHNNGLVRVVSGRNNALLYSLEGSEDKGKFGTSLAAMPDLNGDGIEDIAIAASGVETAHGKDTGVVYLHSGLDGTLLLTIEGTRKNQDFGENLACAGDVDGDDIGDIVVGVTDDDFDGNHKAGAVYVYSGADGHLIHTWGGSADQERAGESVTGNFDLDKDGYADVMFGANHADPSPGNNTGSAYIYSGQTGLLMMRLDGVERGDNFGKTVAAAGDLNGDQITDFAIGAHLVKAGSLKKAGAVFVHSGTDGSLIMRIDGLSKDGKLGSALDAGQDFNNDGLGDLLVGAPGVGGTGNTTDGEVYVFSGADGSLLRTYTNQDDGKDFAETLAWAGDLDRDGHVDILLGAKEAQVSGLNKAGRVRIESGSTSFPYSIASEGTQLTSGSLVQVTVNGIRDLNGNVMASPLLINSVVVGDISSPLGVDVVRNLWLDPSGAMVDMRFNEAIDLSPGGPHAFTTSSAANLLESTLIDQGTVVRLRFDAPLAVGDTVTVVTVKDLAGNVRPSWGGTVSDDPGVTPTLASSSFELVDGGTVASIQVEFQQAILELDAIAPTLWSLETSGGVMVDISAADFTFDASSKSLQIRFQATPQCFAGNSYKVTVKHIRDRHGNYAASLQASGIVTGE